MLHAEPGRQAGNDRYYRQINKEQVIMSTESITDAVKEKYGQAALRVVAGGSSRLI